jgi:hypothetical protein
MFDRFTERARKVIALAREEAGRLGHDYIGTETERQQHETDLNCQIEDNIGLRCQFPNLKEEVEGIYD